jgi:hypothetical protein
MVRPCVARGFIDLAVLGLASLGLASMYPDDSRVAQEHGRTIPLATFRRKIEVFGGAVNSTVQGKARRG